MTPSLGARRLIMASYLYYRRHSPIMSDGIYDQLALGVAKRYDRLDDFLKWQLGSPDEIVTTGSHFKITKQGESAATAWFREVMGCLPHGDPIAEWRYSKNGQVHWTTVGG
jgi:hypothetical protein